LAVVGTVHPDAIWPKNGARPGDALFLTKPLGTGLVLAAHGKGLARSGELDEAIRCMRALVRDAAGALRPFEPSAVTDVTGFGLPRALEVAPARFFRLASLSVASLFLIVATGAAVRLTASGLGCDAWPGCEHRSFFPENNLHGTIEFGNRIVGVLPITLSL